MNITLPKIPDWSMSCPFSNSRGTCTLQREKGINICPEWHETEDYGYFAAPTDCPLLTHSVTVSLV